MYLNCTEVSSEMSGKPTLFTSPTRGGGEGVLGGG